MKRYFRMICTDQKGNKKISQWIDMESRNIFELMHTYELATKKYKMVCNIEYMEDLKA